MRLTEAGEALVRHADAILARLAEAEAELEAIAGLRGGRLRLAAFESAGRDAHAAGDRRASASATRPSSCRMSLAEPEDALAALRSRRARPRARRSTPASSGPLDGRRSSASTCSRTRCTSCCRRPPARAQARRCGSPTWPTRRGSAGTADCECNRLISRACAVAGFEPRIAFETDDYAADAGLRRRRRRRLADRRARRCATVRDDIVVRSLGRETPVRQIFAATLDGGYRSPAAAAMLDVLREVAARHATRRPELELVG